MENKQDLESCLEKTEEILKKARNTKDWEEIKKILPSWSELNRLHANISSLLEYHR